MLYFFYLPKLYPQTIIAITTTTPYCHYCYDTFTYCYYYYPLLFLYIFIINPATTLINNFTTFPLVSYYYSYYYFYYYFCSLD